MFDLISYDHMIGTNSTHQERQAHAQSWKTQVVSPGNKMAKVHMKSRNIKIPRKKLRLHELLLSSLWKFVKIKDREVRSKNEERQQNGKATLKNCTITYFRNEWFGLRSIQSL